MEIVLIILALYGIGYLIHWALLAGDYKFGGEAHFFALFWLPFWIVMLVTWIITRFSKRRDRR